MKFRLSAQNLPLLATTAICIALYVTLGLIYPKFFSMYLVSNLLRGNAVLGIAAIGMTFVILSGGIDLSVGSIIGCTSIVIATLIERHYPLAVAMPLMLIGGIICGAAMGCLIQVFGLPPFLVTLAGLFFFRGLALVVSQRSIGLPIEIVRAMMRTNIPLGGRASLSTAAMIFVALLIVAMVIARYTRFGRNIYAIGGSETSAILMGLPVARTKIFIYAFSGFCSTLAGCVLALDTGSGNAIAATGLELDAIAAVVVGGTLLSGGVGSVTGTLIGTLIFGIIQTAISFQGQLSSWWTRIAVGILLLLFVVMQRFLTRRAIR